MMKSVKILIIIGLVVVILFNLTGCVNFQMGSNIVTGNGIIETREKSISNPLSGVKTMGAIDIMLDAELHDKLILEGDSNLLDLVEINQNNQGILEINFKQGTSIVSSQNIKVYAPIINGGLLETTSVGSIRLKGNEVLTGDLFDLRVSSTGSIQLNVEAKELKANSSSTGIIAVIGSADKSDITLNSTGYFDGFDFKIIDAKISVNGPGGANVNVSGELQATISGPGSIVYDGNPNKISSSGGGPGKLQSRQ